MAEKTGRARKTRKRVAQLRKNLPTVFRARAVAANLCVSTAQARRILAYWASTGRLRRVSYGWYSFAGEAKCADFAIAEAAVNFPNGYLGGSAAAVRGGILRRDKYRLGASRKEAIDWVVPVSVPRRFVRVAGHWFCFTTSAGDIKTGIIRKRIGGASVRFASRLRSATDAFLWSDCWPSTRRRMKIISRYLARTPPRRDRQLIALIRASATPSKSLGVRRKKTLKEDIMANGDPRAKQFLEALSRRSG